MHSMMHDLWIMDTSAINHFKHFIFFNLSRLFGGGSHPWKKDELEIYRYMSIYTSFNFRNPVFRRFKDSTQSSVIRPFCSNTSSGQLIRFPVSPAVSSSLSAPG